MWYYLHMSENHYAPLLHPGETVTGFAEPYPDSPEWAYGYKYGEVRNSTHEAGNSVLLDIQPMGAVEPVLITDKITLSVKALHGKGYAVIYNVKAAEGVRLVRLDPRNDSLALRRWDAYYFINNDTENLILRDDSTPAFQGHEELQLTVEPNTEREGASDGRKIELPNAFWQPFELLNPRQPELADDPVVRGAQLKDIERLKPILEHWIRDRDKGHALPEEVDQTIAAIKESIDGKNERQYIVIEDTEGHAVGIMGFKKPDKVMKTFARTKNTVEFINAYVDPRLSGKGVGSILLRELEEVVRLFGYKEVIVNSGPRYKDTAWDFWTKAYGEPAYIAKEYYGRGGDAPVWRKQL